MAHVLGRRAAATGWSTSPPYGYDERQFCSPGFDLPVGCLSRTPYAQYPEYHTSADDLDLVGPAQLQESLEVCWEVVGVLEGNRRYLNLSPKGEPQLGRRGLYGQIGGRSDAEERQMAMLWVLNLSDGDMQPAPGGRARRAAVRPGRRRRRRPRAGRAAQQDRARVRAAPRASHSPASCWPVSQR